jgi:hypothetical protein
MGNRKSTEYIQGDSESFGQILHGYRNLNSKYKSREAFFSLNPNNKDI